MATTQVTSARARWTIAAAFVAASSLVSRAQEQPPPAPTPAAEPAPATADPAVSPRAAGRSLEEIVVTARQREETLQDVPVAVTAISAEQLQRYNVSDLMKVAQMTPQLFISEGASGNGGSLSIRGIGSSSTTAGFDQAVSIYLDGLQYDRGNVLTQGYFDLAHVEVLKGPQALFFGKNNTAGVVSLRSADPGPEREFIGRLGNEFYNDERWAEAIASGPVFDGFGARLGVRFSEIEGYMENLAPAMTDPASGTTVPPPADRRGPKKEEFLGRLTFKYEPTENFDVSLKVAGAKADGGSVTQNVEMWLCKAIPGRSQLDAGEDCRRNRTVRQNDVAPEIASTEPIFDTEDGALFNHYYAYNLALTANYTLGVLPARLTSITGYAKFNNQYLGDFDFTGTPLIFAAEEADHRSISQEFRLLSSFEYPVNFMLGGFYQKTDFFFRDIARVFPLPQDPTTGRWVTWDRHSPTDGQTQSVFGQLLWDVLETVELAGGLRFSRVTKDSFTVHDYVHPLLTGQFRPVGDPLVGDFSDNDLSPELSATWRPELRPDTDLTLFAAYKRGFKAGGFSNSAIIRTQTTPDDALFESEKVSGFEGGIKSTWFERALLVNVVGYTYEFKDLQVNFFDSAAINFVVQNAAAATTTGAEAEFQWLPPVEGLDFHGSLSFNIAEFDDFISFCHAGQSQAGGCTLDANGDPAPAQATHQDLSETPTPLAPPWTAGLGVSYQRPLFDLWARPILVGFGADGSYTDNYLLSPLGRFDARQHRFFRTDATLSFFEQEGLLEFSIIGKNLSNAYFVSLADVDSPLSGAASGTAAPGVLADHIGVSNRGREVALQLTARF